MALRQGSDVPQCNIVTRMPLSKIALLCKQTNDNFRTAHGAIYRLIDYYLFLIMINKSLKEITCMLKDTIVSITHIM